MVLIGNLSAVASIVLVGTLVPALLLPVILSLAFVALVASTASAAGDDVGLRCDRALMTLCGPSTRTIQVVFTSGSANG